MTQNVVSDRAAAFARDVIHYIDESRRRHIALDKLFKYPARLVTAEPELL